MVLLLLPNPAGSLGGFFLGIALVKVGNLMFWFTSAAGCIQPSSHTDLIQRLIKLQNVIEPMVVELVARMIIHAHITPVQPGSSHPQHAARTNIERSAPQLLTHFFDVLIIPKDILHHQD